MDLVNLLQQVTRRVTVVGDDAQSIYRFRGAEPGVFGAFRAAYDRAGLTAMLTNNYRWTR